MQEDEEEVVERWSIRSRFSGCLSAGSGRKSCKIRTVTGGTKQCIRTDKQEKDKY
jgi:hypothetical protein